MSPHRSRSLAMVAVLTTMLVAVLGGGVAYAAWSTGGSGTGRTTAGSLVTPDVTASRSTTAPSSAVDLSWSATSQFAGVSYSVVRSPGNVTLNCTSSPCSDTGLSPGTTYTYAVTAKLHSWTAAGIGDRVHRHRGPLCE